MGANLKGLANTLKNKIYQAKKKGIDTSFIPRGYSKLPDSQKLNLINRLGQQINGGNYSYQDIHNTITPKKIKTSKPKTKYGYKDFLKASGLHDTTQAKQIYKDIKDFTKISRNLEQHMGEIRLVMDNDRFIELKNIIGNKGTIKDYIENTPKFMLKYSPYEKMKEITHKFSHKYVDEILIRKNCGLSEKDYNNFMKKFDSMPIYRRIQMNQIVYDKYYEEYEEIKQKGAEFNSFEVLNKIANNVMKGDFQ